MSHYVFYRGRDRDSGEERGEMRGSVRVDRDSRGNESMRGDVSGSFDFGNGLRAEGSAGGSLRKDREGNVSGEMHVEGEVSKKF